MTVVPVPLDPRLATCVYRRHLPHWRQDGAAYFVTCRLADSVPAHILQEWLKQARRWREIDPALLTPQQSWQYKTMLGRKLMKYLDTNFGSCALTTKAHREPVAGAMRHFEGERYLLGEYAIMPNVHALVLPLPGWDLTKILTSWAVHSAMAINRLSGCQGKLWQDEPFDHIVRHRVAFGRFAEYIKANPAGLAAGMFETGRGQLVW